MVILFAAENNFCPVVNNFLKPREVCLSTVTIDGDTVPNLRDNQCIDQLGDDRRWAVVGASAAGDALTDAASRINKTLNMKKYEF